MRWAHPGYAKPRRLVSRRAQWNCADRSPHRRIRLAARALCEGHAAKSSVARVRPPATPAAKLRRDERPRVRWAYPGDAKPRRLATRRAQWNRAERSPHRRIRPAARAPYDGRAAKSSIARVRAPAAPGAKLRRDERLRVRCAYPGYAKPRRLATRRAQWNCADRSPHRRIRTSARAPRDVRAAKSCVARARRAAVRGEVAVRQAPGCAGLTRATG